MFPVMQRFDLHLCLLLELEETVPEINSWNTGQGKEVRVKVRRLDGLWRGMDQMVDSMLDELAHVTLNGYGDEWCELRNQLMLEYQRQERTKY